MKLSVSFVTLSFFNSRAAMPTTFGCLGFFYAYTLAIAVAYTIAVAAPCAFPVMGKAVPGNWNLAAGSAATAIFLSTPEGCDRAIRLLSLMVSKNNCHPKGVGSPAKAASTSAVSKPTPIKVLSEYIMMQDDPSACRLMLRSWFLLETLHQSDGGGVTHNPRGLCANIELYELLDELLADLTHR